MNTLPSRSPNKWFGRAGETGYFIVPDEAVVWVPGEGYGGARIAGYRVISLEADRLVNHEVIQACEPQPTIYTVP